MSYLFTPRKSPRKHVASTHSPPQPVGRVNTAMKWEEQHEDLLVDILREFLEEGTLPPYGKKKFIALPNTWTAYFMIALSTRITKLVRKFVDKERHIRVTQPLEVTTLELGLVGMMTVGRSMQLRSNGNTSERYAFTFISNICLFLCPFHLDKFVSPEIFFV